MKISTNKVNFLAAKYKTGPDPLADGLDKLVKRIGEQLGAIEEIVEWAPKFEGILVAEIVSCEPHADSDHLNVCKIYDGGIVKDIERDEKGLIQVVCGAPNVAKGQTIAWIPPGSIVPSTFDGEPFVLSVRDIRGVKSNGMIASPRELGISEDHDGILVITKDEVGEDLSKPGTEFKKLFGLSDVVIDVENKMFTHRPDCFGQLGVARELAGISGKAYHSPDWYISAIKHEVETDLPLEVKNDVTKQVPRFMAQVMGGVKLGKSPIWLQSYLARIGVKSINNIVDLTNYFMTLTGQPLHAFDYDKIKSLSGKTPSLAPRMAKDGEELTLLGGKKIKLTKDDIVIATDKQAVALAGIMGGADSEVDQNTTNIIIECANFDMYTIRRSSMRHGLFTDASTRYTKGQSPRQNDKVLAKIVDDIKDNCGGKVASKAFDLGVYQKTQPAVAASTEFINARLGSKLKLDAMAALLRNVEFEVGSKDDGLLVTPPFWRTDIEQPEDIVEEIGRLHGFNELPAEMPKRSTKAASRNSMLDFKQFLSDKLSANGANEVLTYSFVHGDLMRKTGSDPEKWAFHIRNAISPDLQYYRTSLMPSLLEKVHPNIKSDLIRTDDNEFALYETGRVHLKGHEDLEKLPQEMERLAFIFAADDKTAGRKYQGSAYYIARKYLFNLTSGQAVFEPLESNDFPISAPYQIGRSAVVKIGDTVLGVIGEFRSSVRKALKLPDFCAGFELDIELLKTNLKESGYTVMPAFPKLQQDVTFKVDEKLSYAEVYGAVWEQLIQAEAEHGYFSTLGPRDIYQPEGEKHKNITLRIWLSHHDRTLTIDEVNALLDKIADKLKDSLNAERV